MHMNVKVYFKKDIMLVSENIFYFPWGFPLFSTSSHAPSVYEYFLFFLNNENLNKLAAF